MAGRAGSGRRRLLYSLALLFSHLGAFHYGQKYAVQILHHLASLPLGFSPRTAAANCGKSSMRTRRRRKTSWRTSSRI